MYSSDHIFTKSEPLRIIFIGIMVFLTLLFLASSPVHAAFDLISPGANPANSTDVELFFDTAVPAGLVEYNIPGATVSAVQDGELIFAKGYGYADLANKTPVDADSTLFHIGSITKLFTWTCVMQLVEEDGKIDLDADINTYLTDFSIPDTYPGQPITMRNLMTHSAGFEDAAGRMTVEDVADIYPFRIYCRDNIPARVYPPGTVTSYSNYGATLAAVIIEDVTGVSFEQYLQEHIITPLSLTKTHISYSLPPESAANLSSGYHYAGKNVAVPDDVYIIGPAGTISSTAPDMAVFLAAHMENGTLDGVEILSEETAALMHAPAFSNDPQVSGMCLGFYETYLNNERIILHGGDTDTFHSLLVIIPEKKSGFFVSYNSPGGNKARNDLLMAYVNWFYPLTETVALAPDADLKTPVATYAGTYQSTRHNYRSFEFFFEPPQQMTVEAGENNTLFLLRGGAAPQEYIAIAPGVFKELSETPSFNGNMVFRENEKGDVTFLCLENIPVFAFERVPWYATEAFTEGVFSVAIVLILSVFLWPVMALSRRVYGKKDEMIRERGLPLYARLVAFLASVLGIIFVFGLIPMVQANEGLIDAYLHDVTVPFTLVALLTVPVISVLLSVLTAGFTVLVWKMRFWTFWHRVHYTLVTIGLFMLVWWLNYQNLFFFRL